MTEIWTDNNTVLIMSAVAVATPPGTYPNYILLHPELSYIYLTALAVFMLMGDIGNIMVLGAVFVDKRLRTKGGCSKTTMISPRPQKIANEKI